MERHSDIFKNIVMVLPRYVNRKGGMVGRVNRYKLHRVLALKSKRKIEGMTQKKHKTCPGPIIVQEERRLQGKGGRISDPRGKNAILVTESGIRIFCQQEINFQTDGITLYMCFIKSTYSLFYIIRTANLNCGSSIALSLYQNNYTFSFHAIFIFLMLEKLFYNSNCLFVRYIARNVLRRIYKL